MDREETNEAIKVMQAYVDGANIEWAINVEGYFTPDNAPIWNWADFKFRVKPAKPLTGMFDEERQFIPGKSFRLNIPCIELTNEVKDALETAGIPYVDK